MNGAFLVVAVLVGQVAAPDPAALVTQLGASRFAEREAAASALGRLGRGALPALRAVRDVKDREIRTRAAALITKIEGELLTAPTMVVLDFQDRPLPDVVRAIGDRSGIKMAIFPEQPAGVQPRNVTLTHPEPLPFWQALDRLCDVGQLQYNFGMHGMPNARESVFPLFFGMGRLGGPISDEGPFRVNLVGLHYQRDVQFSSAAKSAPFSRTGQLPKPAAEADDPARPSFNLTEEFYAQLQVAAEPRLSLTQTGALKLVEAVDDRGQSLLIEDGEKSTAHRSSAYFGLTAGPGLHLQAPLRRPEQPGRLIRRLRGRIPVNVASRKGDPLVVPLSGSIGKTFQNAETTLEVQEVRVNPNTNQTSIQIVVRPNREAGGDAALLAALPTALGRRHEAQQQQLDVIDSQGRTIPWYLSNDGEGHRMTLTLTPHDQGQATEIRYYSVIRAATEVSFEFRDVPLPLPSS